MLEPWLLWAGDQQHLCLQRAANSAGDASSPAPSNNLDSFVAERRGWRILAMPPATSAGEVTGRAGYHGTGRPGNNMQPALKNALAPTAESGPAQPIQRQPASPRLCWLIHRDAPGQAASSGLHVDTDQYIKAALTGTARVRAGSWDALQPAAVA